MILDSIATPVEVNGGGATGSFSIAMNGKAFRVLSDTLYQNKIGSIVRELSCNAYDAHIMNNNQSTPFEIHLPDAFCPWFTVQDFGIGLSPEDVRTVFTVYFSSTKEQSNDTIGAFGLGAKTPFSYTDQFTISSVKDGLRTVYNAYITESGVPNIVVLFEEQTTDNSGVEIKMSVKREDYSKFSNEVVNQLKYFKVKPNITNGSVKWDDASTWVISTPNVSLMDSSAYNRAQPVVVQGNVGYPIDINLLSGKIKPENYGLLQTVYDSKCVFYFEIGTIGVTASREGIEYNKVTIDNIDAKLDVVRAELVDYVQDQLKTVKNDWDRVQTLNNSALLRKFAGNYIIKNTKKIYDNYWFDMRPIAFTVVSATATTATHNVTHFTVGEWHSHRQTTRFNSKLDFGGDHRKFVFVLVDKATRIKERIKQVFIDNPGLSSVYTIERPDQTYSAAFIDSVKQQVGGFDKFILLSAVALPKKIGQSRTGVKVCTHYEFNGNVGTSLNTWNKKHDKLEDNKTLKVYVSIPASTINFGYQTDELIRKYQTVTKIQQNTPELVCIREANLKKIEHNKTYVKLVDFVAEKIREYNTEENKKKIRNAHLYHDLYVNHNNDYKPKYEVLKNHCKDNEITKVLGIIFTNHKKYEKTDLIVNIAKLIGYNRSYQNSINRINRTLKNVINKYPLVKTWKHYSFSGTIQDESYVEYLNATQQMRKTQQTVKV